MGLGGDFFVVFVLFRLAWSMVIVGNVENFGNDCFAFSPMLTVRDPASIL